MTVCRRIGVWALALVVLLAVGASAAAARDATDATSATSATPPAFGAAVQMAGESPSLAPAVEISSPTAHTDDHGTEAPCVMRADCAGALVLGGLGLLLALPAIAPSIGGLSPLGAVVTPSPRQHLPLRATRLFRPPRLS